MFGRMKRTYSKLIFDSSTPFWSFVQVEAVSTVFGNPNTELYVSSALCLIFVIRDTGKAESIAMSGSQWGEGSRYIRQSVGSLLDIYAK
jgi:hypothetical protein